MQPLHEIYPAEDGLYVGFKERREGVEEEMIAISEVTTRLGYEQDECLGSPNGEDSRTSE